MEHANKKVAPKYECKKCPYVTCKKSSWQKHIDTKKHKKQLLLSENVALNNVCKHCNKSFSHTSSAIRHEKQCIEKSKNNTPEIWLPGLSFVYLCVRMVRAIKIN